MKVLSLGGSPNHLGGVEAFCARANEALERAGARPFEHLYTHTAYLTLARLPALFRGLAAFAFRRGERPDLVWLQYVCLPDLLYLLLAKALGYKILVTPHLGLQWRSQSNPVLRAVGTWILGLTDRFALLSKTQERELRLPERAPRSYIRTFLPAVLGTAAAPPESPRGGPVLKLVHACRLSEGKGTFRFVDVCRHLVERGVAIEASIAGGADEETMDRLRRMIAERGLDRVVRLRGRVSDEDLLDILRASDVLVHLSAVDSYPLIVLECLTLGVFPICMDLLGVRDMAATYDGHIVASADAAHDAAEFLSRQDPEELRQRAARAALRVRDDYDWNRCVRLLEAAFAAPIVPEAAPTPVRQTRP